MMLQERVQSFINQRRAMSDRDDEDSSQENDSRPESPKNPPPSKPLEARIVEKFSHDKRE